MTWILQSNKRFIPDFDSWYESQQSAMRSDAVMRWIVDARNQIVKQGDLQTSSRAKATLVVDWKQRVHQEWMVDPRLSIEEIFKMIDLPKLPEALSINAVLAVERRWVCDGVRDHELLDALSHAYGVLAGIVDGAHRQMGLDGSEIMQLTHEGDAIPVKISGEHLRGRMPCMIATVRDRTVWVRVSTGQPMALAPSAPSPKATPEEVLARYQSVFDLPPFATEGLTELEVLAGTWFARAQQVMRVDGYHLPTYVLLSKGEVVRLVQLVFRDDAEKFRLMEECALEVLRYGCDSVVEIAETWFAPYDPEHPNRRASLSPDRKDMLSVTALLRDGSEYAVFAIYSTVTGTVVFEQPQRSAGAYQTNVLNPIRRVWGLPLPK